jgi:hypothetical protein
MMLRGNESEAQPCAVSKGAATRRSLGTGLACRGLTSRMHERLDVHQLSLRNSAKKKKKGNSVFSPLRSAWCCRAGRCVPTMRGIGGALSAAVRHHAGTDYTPFEDDLTRVAHIDDDSRVFSACWVAGRGGNTGRVLRSTFARWHSSFYFLDSFQ